MGLRKLGGGAENLNQSGIRIELQVNKLGTYGLFGCVSGDPSRLGDLASCGVPRTVSCGSESVRVEETLKAQGKMAYCWPWGKVWVTSLNACGSSSDWSSPCSESLQP